MSSKSDFLAPYARIGLTASASALAIVLLGACSTRPNPKSTEQTAAPCPLPAASGAPAPATASPAQINPGPAVLSAVGASAPSSADLVVRLLAYADRVRSLTTTELTQEVTRLASAPSPAEQLQLALVLSQLRQTPELIRAQELLTRVINSSALEAQSLHPLARLLAARYGEQRRLEDQLDKQSQQLREVQRRLDQTHERLEALKAIERSLTSRPPASAPSAPASRPRTRPAAP